MRQDLKLSEKLFCLAVKPSNGGFFYNTSSTLNMTLVGLVFVELAIKGIITIENDFVYLVNPALQIDEIHEFILTPIRFWKKALKVRTWLAWFDFRRNKIKKMFLRSLVKKYILRIEEKRFLFIPYNKVYLMDRELVESIRKEVETLLLKRTGYNNESIILAQMVNQNNLLVRIFPDKAIRKEAARNLKEFSDTQVSKAVKQAIHRRFAMYSASH